MENLFMYIGLILTFSPMFMMLVELIAEGSKLDNFFKGIK